MPCVLAASQMIWFDSARKDFSPVAISNVTMWVVVVVVTPGSSFRFFAIVARRVQTRTAQQCSSLPNGSLGIVETAILAVRSFARFSSAEMA